MGTDVGVGTGGGGADLPTAARPGLKLSLALLAGVAYPLAPPVLFAAATAALDPVAHAAAVAAGIVLVLAVPVAGAALLWSFAGQNDAGALQARGTGMLLVI